MTNLSIRVPQARRDDLVTTATQDDLLIYDQATHELHQLNQVSASIWELCDGNRTIADLAAATGHAAEVVTATVEMLSAASLLDTTISISGDTSATRSSRRRLMKRAAIAAPVIVSVSAPMAAGAKSDTCMLPCSKDSQCRGGCPVCKQYSPSNSAYFCCNSKEGTRDYCYSK